MENNIFWIIFEFTVNLYESLILISFICSSLKFKRDIHNHRLIFLTGVAVMTLSVTILDNVVMYEGLLGIIYSLCFFAYSLFFLNGGVLKKLFIAIFTNAVLIGVSTAIANIMSFILKDSIENIYNERTTSRLLVVVIGQALITYVFGLLRHFTNNKLGSLKPKEWLLILSVLGISFVTFAMIHITALEGYMTDGDIKLLMASEFGIILINIVCLYITVNLSKIREHEEELIALNKQNEYSRQYAQSVRTQYEQTCRLRHDMKQHYTVLGRLLSDNKLYEAKSFVAECYDSIFLTEVVIDVGNDYVNAILNAKLSAAKSRGIGVVCSAEKDISGFGSADLCSLIGNLLDNAMEAAEKCEPQDRSIEFNMSVSGNHMNITVRNSIVSSVLSQNKKLATTKKNVSEHGFGLKTINFIAEKYGGTTDFYEEGLTFISHIVIYK